jgi:multiple sugar transport system substrate-binding protein
MLNQQREITRRDFLKVVTIAAGGVIAGCGYRHRSGDRVTLTQWYHQYGETGTQDAVIRYAREYTRINPKVEIRVVWVPGDYGSKLATAMLTPNGPDIFEYSGPIAAMVGAGQIASHDDLFPADVRNDFSSPDLVVNTCNNKIYGIKMLDDVGLLYYRKSVLESAGIEPPSTVSALLDAAKKLTTATRKGLFVGNDGGMSALCTLLPWSAGSDFLDGNKIVFNNPRTVAAYEWLRTIGNSDAVLIGAPSDWWDPSAFTQGLTAMQWTGLWAYPAIRKAFGDDVGAMPWPALDGSGTPVTFVGGWSQMVNAQGPYVREAKDFVRWLWIENRRDQLDWNLSYGFHVPPRKSLIEQADALKSPVPAIAVHALSTYGRFLPPLWNNAMNTAVMDALTNSLKRGQPIPGELATASEKCTREVSRALEAA